MDDSTAGMAKYWGSVLVLTGLFFVMLAPGGSAVRIGGLLAVAVVFALLAVEMARRFVVGGSATESFTPYRR